MKTRSYLAAALLFALFTGLAQAEVMSTNSQEDIPWTWDDIQD